MDVIGLRQGMTVGEAGASYGYFTFKMSRRVGPTGVVYANDIDSDALRTIEQRSASLKVGNIKTVLGEVADPRFPRSDLDLIVVFDCLFEFSGQVSWMQNARKYLKRRRPAGHRRPGPFEDGVRALPVATTGARLREAGRLRRRPG